MGPLLSPDMVTTAMLMVMDIPITDTDTSDTIMAKDLLSPLPLLSPDMVTTAMDTVMLTVMDIPITDTDTITARGPLKPNPLTDTTVIPMPTMVTTVMDSVMVMVTTVK